MFSLLILSRSDQGVGFASLLMSLNKEKPIS